ncbi:Acyl-CoA N-acyltransferases (Nat) [Penicillium herquei]|nr:Acyl-CoA N-acyltransferases (Nat) [Penicillium herquei]
MGGSQSTPSGSLPYKTRVATKSDLDEITRIHIEGFTEEPQVHYCYPLRHQFPEDHWKWTRKEYENYLLQPEKFVVYVLEAPCESKGGVVYKPIGHAVWNMAVLTPPIESDPEESERRDANRARCEAFKKASSVRFKTYFAEWSGEQVNLSSLVVHPDFRRHGGGTMLVSWGIQNAKEKGWPVTLCASPMGQLLYEHLHFEKIATEVVQVEGEDETLESTVMVLNN